MPISAAGSYDSFDQHRKDVFKKHSFTSNQQSSHLILRTFLSEKSIDAWVKCKLGSQNTEYLKINATYDKDSVTLVYRWDIPQPYTTIARVTDSLVTGGYRTSAPNSKEALDKGTLFKPGSQHTEHYERLLGQDFELYVNTDAGKTAQVIIPFIGGPPPKKKVQRLTINSLAQQCYIQLKGGIFYIDENSGSFGVATPTVPGLIERVHTFMITNHGGDLSLALTGTPSQPYPVSVQFLSDDEGTISVGYQVQSGTADLSMNGGQVQTLAGLGTTSFTL